MSANKSNLSELTQSVSTESYKLTDVKRYVERCASYAGADGDLNLDSMNFCRCDHFYTFYIPLKHSYCIDIDVLDDFRDYLNQYYTASLYVHSDGEIEVNLY